MLTVGARCSSDTVLGSTRLMKCTWPEDSAAVRAVPSLITTISIESTWPRSGFQWSSNFLKVRRTPGSKLSTV